MKQQPKWSTGARVFVRTGMHHSRPNTEFEARILQVWIGDDGYTHANVEVIASGVRGTFDELHMRDPVEL